MVFSTYLTIVTYFLLPLEEQRVNLLTKQCLDVVKGSIAAKSLNSIQSNCKIYEQWQRLTEDAIAQKAQLLGLIVEQA